MFSENEQLNLYSKFQRFIEKSILEDEEEEEDGQRVKEQVASMGSFHMEDDDDEETHGGNSQAILYAPTQKSLRFLRRYL